MNDLNPYVSIILPIYNMSNYLDRCLTSLKNQTLKNIEIICVDDGSIDNSLEICNEYAKRDKRFKVIHQENQGQGVARNTGIGIAQGEYIAFVDPDDWVREDMYKEMYTEAKGNNCDIVQCDYKIITPYNHVIISLKDDYKVLKKINVWKDLIKDNFSDFCLYSVNKIYKLELIKKYGIKFAPLKISEEHQFVIPIILKANKICYIPKIFYYYEIRKGSSDQSYSLERLSASKTINGVKNILVKLNIYEECKKYFYNYSEFVYYWAFQKISKNAIPKLIESASKDLPEKHFNHFLQKANDNRFYSHNNFIQNIFSIKTRNTAYVKEKIFTVFGYKFKSVVKIKKKKKARSSKMKKLSIITICYNDPALELTCKSIINQTWQDFEWIVIDGGSKPEILEKFNKYKHRIDKFISEPDNGIYNAVNKGLALATGEYVHLLNAGDKYFDNDVLKKVFKKHKCNKDVIYGDTCYVNHDGKFVDYIFFPKKIGKLFFAYSPEIINNIDTPATFAKKNLYDKCGYFNENYKIVSDKEKWIQFQKAGATFEHVDVVITAFDKSGISSSPKTQMLHNKEHEDIIHKYYSDEEIKKAYDISKKIQKIGFLDRIFSVKKENTRIILYILFIKIKITNKNLIIKRLKHELENLNYEKKYNSRDVSTGVKE